VYLRNRNTLFDYKKICIYKLAFKCKEWAAINRYSVQSRDSWAVLHTLYEDEINANGKLFYEYTEPEAIFKACEWLMCKTKEV